jgi:hypothetical protein
LNLHHRVGYINDLALIFAFDDRIGNNDQLLRRALERSDRLGFGPQSLDGVHHVHLLVNKRIAKLDRPLEVCVHVFDDGGKFGRRLDVVIPGLIVELTEVAPVLDETRRLHNFERVGGSWQYHSQKRIWVKGNRCHESFEFPFTQLRGSRWRWNRLFLRRRPLRHTGQDDEHNRNHPW